MKNKINLNPTHLDAMTWDLELAIELIKRIEEIAPKHGCHVALTGGVLYKEGQRKDLDILFYRIRQENAIDLDSLFYALDNELEMEVHSGGTWIYKAHWRTLKIDIFIPEENRVMVYDFKKPDSTLTSET